nr:immunoglobulin light chain junction region [Macaca mulatta]MOV61029.1 immunoglobulin light chain junction region [Macaca mulatta]MOV61031.1 immunoglobulin light chain junction region [Macaca mulatta]MOV61078.1 immunoglobulin light chain junction region [Macaca mulatta]MOV61085.1 immunoglobulin light chain junction region [Macaca mulatta]
CQQNRNWPFTF